MCPVCTAGLFGVLSCPREWLSAPCRRLCRVPAGVAALNWSETVSFLVPCWPLDGAAALACCASRDCAEGVHSAASLCTVGWVLPSRACVCTVAMVLVRVTRTCIRSLRHASFCALRAHGSIASAFC
jgi:hypothetical protein